MKGWPGRDSLAAELAGVWRQVILPASALLLPWRVWRALAGRAATRAPAALPSPAEWGVAPPANFRRRLAVHQALDLADYFLTRYRGSRWRDRRLHCSGAQPVPRGPAIFFTYHFGQGFLALDRLRLAGFRIAWLHAPMPASPPPGQRVVTGMGNRRIRHVGKLSGCAAIPTGGSIAEMTRQVERGYSVLVMPDAPRRPGQSTVAVSFLDRPASWPAGAIAWAAARPEPKYAYTIHADLESGDRLMHMHGPLPDGDVQSLAQALADVLTDAVRAEPAAWYGWPYAGEFFG